MDNENIEMLNYKIGVLRDLKFLMAKYKVYIEFKHCGIVFKKLPEESEDNIACIIEGYNGILRRSHIQKEYVKALREKMGLMNSNE